MRFPLLRALVPGSGAAHCLTPESTSSSTPVPSSSRPLLKPSITPSVFPSGAWNPLQQFASVAARLGQHCPGPSGWSSASVSACYCVSAQCSTISTKSRPGFHCSLPQLYTPTGCIALRCPAQTTVPDESFPALRLRPSQSLSLVSQLSLHHPPFRRRQLSPSAAD